jgi:SNF2 family DNA or RNA helicase
MGKTLLTIALTRYFRRLDVVDSVLVLVPYKINKDEWEREIQKWSPNTKYTILRGTSAEKWEQLEAARASIVVETYAGLARMVCPLKTVKRKRSGRSVKMDKLVIDEKLVKRLLTHVDGVVCDESNHVGAHDTLPFRICRRLGNKAGIFFLLAGTPFGRDPLPLWAQIYLVDGGHSLGETLGLFRSALYKSKPDAFGFPEYTFNDSKENMAKLNRLLAHSSIRYEVEQSTLPRRIDIIKEVSLPADADEYYQRARAVIVEAKGSYREMRNAFLRMRQISSGFVGYHDDENGEKARYVFPENPKLDALMALIDSIREDRKILVFHDFRHSGEVIAAALTTAGISHIKYGGKQTDAKGLLQRFESDPRLRVFVLSTAGAYGLNLQAAQYGIFYESPVPVITRKQMIRRFERQNSPHDRVFLYDLVTIGTMDRRILDFYKAGQNLFDAIVRGIEKV